MSAYISELSYHGNQTADFIEIRVPVGTDVSSYSVVVYQHAGAVGQTLSFGSVASTSWAGDVYAFNDATPGFANLSNNDAVALVDDLGNVVQFISFDGNTVTATEGPANGLSSTDIGSASNGDSLETSDDGASYSVQTAPNEGTIPCYAPGTMIDTPDGPRAVETLSPGDLVMTLDHGPQAIRWTHSGDHPLKDVDNDAKPVQIKAGALGHDLPTHDLIVSPQHRILVGVGGQLSRVFAGEAFAPAKSLTEVPGIRHMKGKRGITWVHFACDRHEVVTANGCLSESLLLGPMVVNGLSSAKRLALTDIFGPAPTPDAALNGPPARNCLTVGAVKRQLAKHHKENGKRVAKESRKWSRDLAMETYETERLHEAASLAHPSQKALRIAQVTF